jgi:hypothetical protein
MSEDHEASDQDTRIAELETENKRLRAENELFRTEHKIAGGFATLVLAGPSLVNAFRKWFHVVKREKEAPVEESADLAAAITRRLINVGIIGLFFASIFPAGLLLWQNTLIRSQNEYFQQQNQHLQEQNKVILDDSTRARRAQLIATIYDEDCNLVEEAPNICDGLPGCPPKAHIRSRTEATLALAELDLGIDRLPSLAWAKLPQAQLRKANFQGANLWAACLRQANLYMANLQGSNLWTANLLFANLQGANLYEANLEAADLGRANLQEADLRGAILERSKLYGAHLRGAKLQGADLRWAESLTMEQLAAAIIDENTKLPDYLIQHRSELLESSKRALEELEHLRDAS